MSAAKPISHSVVLLGLGAVAALGFWMGFRDSFMAQAGIRACTPASSPLSFGGDVPLATPVGVQPVTPAEEIKPEPEKKKPEPVKADDPGTEQTDLPPVKAAKPPVITPPAATPTPTEPPPASDPTQQPPPY